MELPCPLRRCTGMQAPALPPSLSSHCEQGWGGPGAPCSATVLPAPLQKHCCCHAVVGGRTSSSPTSASVGSGGQHPLGEQGQPEPQGLHPHGCNCAHPIMSVVAGESGCSWSQRQHIWESCVPRVCVCMVLPSENKYR